MLLIDFGQWCSDILEREITKVINRNQYRERPYWVLVVSKSRYAGPKSSAKQTKDVILKGNVINTTLILIPDKSMLPPCRQLGTALLKVNNKTGQSKWVYVLPPDKPIMQPVEYDGESEFVGKSARGIPILH